MKLVKLLLLFLLFTGGAAVLLFSLVTNLSLDVRQHPTATGEWLTDILKYTPMEVVYPTLEPPLATLPPMPALPTFLPTWTPVMTPTLPDIRLSTPTP